MPKPFVIYRSSAGSGKTYTLTKEYLKLAFRHPDYFKHILAVTFTNKATKEMKMRVLSVLAELANGPHALSYELKEATGLDDEGLKERASQVLSHILHDYSHFSISTIDSFFQRVIRAFAREMGLQGGFRIELDEEQVLTEVIDKVLLEVGQNDNLTNWLIKFAETRVDDGKAWDTRREIGNLAKEIFKEQFKEFEPEVLAVAKDESFIPSFLSELNKVKYQFEGTLQELGRSGMDIIRKHNLDVTDFAYKEGGPAGYVEKLATGKINAPGIRIVSSALDVSSWFAKSNPLKAAIKTATEDGLIDILKEAVEFYKANQVPYESANEVLRYLYTYGILADLTAKLEEYRDENELMLISDAAVFLKQIISDSETPFIYEKVGGRYNHYLIDEFQDTSGFQWDNFRPLVENSLAEENYNLVVGDVKQSIYRWRGGDLDLLLNGVQNDIGSERTEFKDLTQNWRSRQYIVDFNNSLFQFAREVLSKQVKLKLEEIEDETSKERLLQKAEKINVAYGEVVQGCAKEFASDEGGLLRFSFLPFVGQNGLEWKDNALLQLPTMIEELQDQKYSLKDIAILVRTRAEGRAVVDHLLNYQSSASSSGYKYDVISSESLYLENSSITRFLIACIKYIYKTDDAIQRVHMAYEFHQYIKPDDCVLDTLFQDAADQSNQEKFTALFNDDFFDSVAELRKKSIYQLIEELIRIFGLEQFEEERAYLQGFLDAVLDFSKNENDDILSFITWWEQIGRERTVLVSEDQDAIRVMTIHMAKGLQFKAVLVPFCEWNIDGLQGFDNILWSQDDTPPFDKAPYLPLNYSMKLKSTVFYRYFYEEMINSYLDNLNILYVAFTRAEEVLMASMPQHRNRGEIRASSGIIDQYFASDFKLDHFREEMTEDFVQLECGNYPTLGVEEIDGGIDPLYFDHFPSYDWNSRLTIKREFTSTVSKEEAVDPNILKAVLTDLESMDQLNKELSIKINEGYAHQKDEKVIAETIGKLLSIEEVKSWYRPNVEVVIKATLLLPEVGEAQIDRMVYSSGSTSIIKFGIGDLQSEDLETLRLVALHLSGSEEKINIYYLDLLSQKVSQPTIDA